MQIQDWGLQNEQSESGVGSLARDQVRGPHRYVLALVDLKLLKSFKISNTIYFFAIMDIRLE